MDVQRLLRVVPFCEAVTRPSMRFVPVKTIEQQAALMLHRSRDLLIRQRTQLINALRAHLAELGMVAARGKEGVKDLVAIVVKATVLPEPMRQALQALVSQLAELQQPIGQLERSIHAQHNASDRSRRLETIPGIGVLGATAIAATITDPFVFKSGRECAAWIGLVPRQNSTGGKERLGGISKQGDRYLRRLLVIGAMAVIRQARTHPRKYPWVMKLLGQEAGQSGCDRAGQQDGAHPLGHFGQGGDLPSADTRGSVLRGLPMGMLAHANELRG